MRAVPDPGERVRPGLEVAGEDPVEHLLPHGRCQRPEVVDGLLGVAGVAGPCSSVDGSWLHHPGRVSRAASANPPRGAPCSGEAATDPPEGAWPQGRDSQLHQEEPGGGERPHCGIWLGQSFSGSFCHVTQGRGRARLSPIAVAAASFGTSGAACEALVQARGRASPTRPSRGTVVTPHRLPHRR